MIPTYESYNPTKMPKKLPHLILGNGVVVAVGVVVALALFPKNANKNFQWSTSSRLMLNIKYDNIGSDSGVGVRVAS